MKAMQKRLPGIVLAGCIAIPAWLLGRSFPIIGSPILGILFGMILAFWKLPGMFDDGVKYTSKQLLQYSIILLGFEMNLFNIVAVGRQTLLLMCFTLTAAFVTAYMANRLIKVDGKAATLIAVGTSICGGSAIAATAPVIHADNKDISHAISTIFLFNVIAAFLFPLLGHALGMSDHAFGLWAGTAVNDTSSVVAAGYTYSNAAGNLAVVVKLTRTLMIVPITLVLAIYTSRQATRDEHDSGYSIAKIFPWFVLGFVAAAIINTWIPMPQGVGSSLARAGKFVIVMAMVSIGLNTNIGKLVKSGGKSVLLGFICWLALSLTALGTLFLFGHLGY